MSKVITAIDIGSSNIKALLAIVDDEGNAKVIGEATQPSFGVKKGEIIGIDEAINSIAGALTGAERMAGLTVSSAYVSINGKNITSQNSKGVVAIADSEIVEEDALRALGQAKTAAIPNNREIIHLIPREFLVDQQNGIKNPIGMTGSRLEVDSHIVSAPTTSIHNIERCIQNIGLKIDAPVFTGWASSKAVLTSTERELGVLLLDIGGGTTSISTFVEDAVTFSASVPFGGSNVTRDLAAGLRLSLDDAERVKVNASDLMKSNNSNKSAGKQENGAEKDLDIIDVTSLNIEGVDSISKKLFSEIIEARIEEIFRDMVLPVIEQYGQEYSLPAGIVITGGSANLPGITGIAKKVFGVPARVGHPSGLKGLTDGISTTAYATLYGLILHALDEDISYQSGSNTSQGIKGKGLVDRISSFLKNFLP